MSELYIQRSPIVAYRRLGRETTVMTARDSTLFNLNETATLIWESADGQKPLSEVVQNRICEEFDVELPIALQDALEFVNTLAKHGILTISDQPILPTTRVSGVLQ
jgi:hypothetical protein